MSKKSRRDGRKIYVSLNSSGIESYRYAAMAMRSREGSFISETRSYITSRVTGGWNIKREEKSLRMTRDLALIFQACRRSSECSKEIPGGSSRLLNDPGG
jgi:hypothetical protein